MIVQVDLITAGDVSIAGGVVDRESGCRTLLRRACGTIRLSSRQIRGEMTSSDGEGSGADCHWENGRRTLIAET